MHSEGPTGVTLVSRTRSAVSAVKPRQSSVGSARLATPFWLSTWQKEKATTGSDIPIWLGKQSLESKLLALILPQFIA
eukprot:6516831-Pyramimonas_sp.AAC.1